MNSIPILSRELWNNTIADYLIAFAIMAGGILLVELFKRGILRRAQKWADSTATQLDDLLVSTLDRFILPIVRLLLIYWGVSYLALSPRFIRVFDIVISIIIAYFALLLVSHSIQFLLRGYFGRQESGEAKLKQISSLMIVIDIVIWTLGAIFLFDNLGYNVSAILTGVGIGGIAIALAAQNIIGDLFNYFVIFFDRPFEVGDSITIDDKNGTIEHIGLKTTRLRSLTGEQIILANSDLTKSRVHNFKRLETRRIQFFVNVNFKTPREKLERIPDMIRQIVQHINEVRFDRAHLARITEYALQFEVVYFVLSPDYLIYMNVQQKINLDLLETFRREKIEFLIREDKPGVWDNS
jgi:small-conductance mechanosensitive channel